MSDTAKYWTVSVHKDWKRVVKIAAAKAGVTTGTWMIDAILAHLRVPDRYTLEVGALADHYGVERTRLGMLGEHALVDVYREDDGWHVSHPLIDDDWAPTSDARAAELYLDSR
jgi:hypothetical protein